MKPCWSGFISTPLTPNWMPSFLSGASVCDIGSRKSSFVIMPTSLSSLVTSRHDMSCLCIFCSASLSVVSGLATITGLVIMPLAEIVRSGVFCPSRLPMDCRSWGWMTCSSMSFMLMIPTSFPFSMTGMWLIPCSLKRLMTAPVVLSASTV